MCINFLSESMDTEEIRFQDLNIAIIGLGLMGGSLALALHGKCNRVVGIDPDRDTVSYALDREIVSAAYHQPKGVLDETDLVILAAPVRSIINHIEALPALHSGFPIVIDLGSTKRQIVDAFDHLPERFGAVGGHPICGKETSSIRSSDPQLYLDAIFVLTASKRTNQRATRTVERLVEVIGARPLWIDADLHDRWIASTSHLPYLLSIGLSLALQDEALSLSGPGIQSATRLARSSVDMMLDILDTNQDYILDQLLETRLWMEKIELALRKRNHDALEKLLAQGRDKSNDILDLLENRSWLG